jgi:hypothetical protein
MLQNFRTGLLPLLLLRYLIFKENKVPLKYFLIHKILKNYKLNKAIFSMVSHMVFPTKLGFENLKNLKLYGRVTELPDGRVTSSSRDKKNFRGLDDDFGLKKPNHHLGPKYVHLHIIRGKKVWYMGRLF